MVNYLAKILIVKGEQGHQKRIIEETKERRIFRYSAPFFYLHRKVNRIDLMQDKMMLAFELTNNASFICHHKWRRVERNARERERERREMDDRLN